MSLHGPQVLTQCFINPILCFFTKNEANGGEAGVKEKNTNLQEGVSRGKGVNNMAEPRSDLRSPATTVAIDFDAEMLDATH